jgi:nicotinamide riboside transporter PnuC
MDAQSSLWTVIDEFEICRWLKQIESTCELASKMQTSLSKVGFSEWDGSQKDLFDKSLEQNVFTCELD